jgi:hypothetical protein
MPGKPSLRRPLALVHHAGAGQVVVLGVLGDRDAEVPRVEEGAAHQLGVPDRQAVVRDRHRAGAHHLADLGQALPRQPLRHRADRVDARPAGAPRLGDDVLGHRPVVVDRIGVGHAGDAGEAARRRRPRAALDRLLVLLPRLAQVDVDVDEAGADDAAGGVEGAHPAGGLDAAADLGDLAVLDQQVRRLVEAL